MPRFATEPFGVYRLASTATGQSVETYPGWLADEAATSSALLTSDRLGADYRRKSIVPS